MGGGGGREGICVFRSRGCSRLVPKLRVVGRRLEGEEGALPRLWGTGFAPQRCNGIPIKSGCRPITQRNGLAESGAGLRVTALASENSGRHRYTVLHEGRVHKSRHETSLGVCGRRNQTKGDATYDRGREAHEDAVRA